MKSFEIKSILMGIGIGIIITSIVGLIYSAGNQSMSKQEVIKKAKEYGLVENKKYVADTLGIKSSEIIKSDENKNKIKDDIESNKNKQNAIKKEQGQIQKNPGSNLNSTFNKIEKKIIIKEGQNTYSVAKVLYENNLIENVDIFVEKMIEKGYDRKIKIGEYSIRVGEPLQDIMKIICNI